MITLITAPPGYGKTVHAVWNEIRPAIEKGRLVYTSGIPKLKLPTISLKDAVGKIAGRTIDAVGDQQMIAG